MIKLIIRRFTNGHLSKAEDLTIKELMSIQKGLEDIKNGRVYKMKDDENMTDFLKRTLTKK